MEGPITYEWVTWMLSLIGLLAGATAAINTWILKPRVESRELREERKNKELQESIEQLSVSLDGMNVNLTSKIDRVQDDVYGNSILTKKTAKTVLTMVEEGSFNGRTGDAAGMLRDEIYGISDDASRER